MTRTLGLSSLKSKEMSGPIQPRGLNIDLKPDRNVGRHQVGENSLQPFLTRHSALPVGHEVHRVRASSYNPIAAGPVITSYHLCGIYIIVTFRFLI